MTHDSGRAAILSAIVGVLILASMVADRYGAPATVIRVLLLGLAVLSVTFVALATASMKVSEFHLAGGDQRLAKTVLLLAGIAGGICGLSPAAGADRIWPVVIAVAAGLALSAIVAGTIRRSGAATFSELVHVRFRSRPVAFIALLAGIFPLGVLAASLGEGAVTRLALAMHLTPLQARLVAFALILLSVLPGGSGSLVRVGIIFGAMALVAYGVPLSTVLATVPRAPGETPTEILPALAQVADGWVWGLGYVLAAAGFFAILAQASVARQARTATAGHLLAAGLLVAAAMAATVAHLAVDQRTARIVDGIPANLPDLAYSERARGLITVCGIAPAQPEDVQRACAGPAGAAATTVRIADRNDGVWTSVVLGLPLVAGIMQALALPLLMVFACACLCHALATTATRDGVYRMGERSGTASGRLAMHRILVVGLAAGALFGGLASALNAHWLRAAVYIMAVVPLPLLLLSRLGGADWRAALCSLAAAAALAPLFLVAWYPDALVLVAAALTTCAAGWAAAMRFPSGEPADRHAADVLAGRMAGPLTLDRSA